MRYKVIIIFLLGIFLLVGCSKGVSDESYNANNDIVIISTSTKEMTTQEITTEETTTQKSITEDEELWGAVSISKDSEVSEAMREVLKGEREFISIDEGNELTNINTFDCFDGESGHNIEIISFRTVDIDEDGNFEVILRIFKEGGTRYTGYGLELLRYYNGNVYGYNINSCKNISGNGGYMSWHGPYTLEADYRCYNGVGRFEFIKDKLTCKYVFESADTESEKWLQESGILNENEKIVCNKEEYEKIKIEEEMDNTIDYRTHTLLDEYIETYVR